VRSLRHIFRFATTNHFSGIHRLIVVVYFPRMAPKKTTLKEIAEMLAHVVKHMANNSAAYQNIMPQRNKAQS
jgi:hypothetical protein